MNRRGRGHALRRTRWCSLSIVLMAGSIPAASVAAGASSMAGGLGPMVRVAPSEPLPQSAQVVGAVPEGAQVSGVLALKSRNPAGLAAAATSASTPGGAGYRHYLPAHAFRSLFGPLPSTVGLATSALRSAGLRTAVSTDGLLVSFHGTASAVRAAFHTSLSEVRLGGGRDTIANTGPISVPQAIAGETQAVVGLSEVVAPTSSIRRAHGVVPTSGAPSAGAQASAAPGPHACADATQAARGLDGQTDDQLAHAYGADALYDQGALGQGQHIALFELEPFAMSDIAPFVRCYLGNQAAAGLASRITVHAVDGGQPLGEGSGEATLDIETAIALSPQADIDVYEAPNSNAGSLLEFDQIVSDDADQEISTSWGLCESLENQETPGVIPIENTIFEQAAVQGQSIFAAAGDDGSSDCQTDGSGLGVDDPASQPYVTAAGGTSMTRSSEPPVEQVWNDGPAGGGGGGGISENWQEPGYQLASKIPGLDSTAILQDAAEVAQGEADDADGSFCQGQPAGGTSGLTTSCREVPDVSSQADELTGALTFYYAGWSTVGGTSVAAPTWAALVADVNSTARCGDDGGVGFLNPALYALASNPTTYASAFNDITLGNNDAFDENNGLFFAGAGYDMASGLGSPRLAGPQGQPGLAALLCPVGAVVRPTISNVIPGRVDQGGGVTASITGTGFEVDGVPAISSVEVGSLTLVDTTGDPTSFVVTSPTTLTVTVPAASLQAAAGTPSNETAVSVYGTGRYAVSVTTSSGVTSALDASSTLLETATQGGSTIPSIDGVERTGGPDAGGGEVTIVGAGFEGATAVSFGGVASPSFSVLSPTRLRAVVPAFVPGTTQCATNLDPTTDICQSAVVVTNASGSSATEPILAPSYDADTYTGGLLLTPGCNCETVPAPDEYDYLPTPVVTSVVATDDVAGMFSERIGGTAVVNGIGLDPFGVIAPVLGDPEQADDYLAGAEYLSPTSMLVTIPALGAPLTTQPVSVDLAVETLASPDVDDPAGSPNEPSEGVTIDYAGRPTITSISTAAGPSTGGTALTIEGQGARSVDQVLFKGIAVWSSTVPGLAYASSYSSDAALDAVTVTTPKMKAGPAIVRLCSITACSTATVRFTFFNPGAATISSISPTGGPSGGGGVVTISGSGLSCALRVEFGTRWVPAIRVASTSGCGSSTMLEAQVPPGTAGRSVPISVLTLEGQRTGTGPVSGGSVRYRYG